jgi:hypothetical protein
MTRTRRFMAAALAVMSLAITAPVAVAGSFTSDHKCSPGQQGNQQPGFKPGSC